MTLEPIQVLLVEDNPDDVVLLREALARDPLAAFQLTNLERLSQSIQILQTQNFDVVLLDLGLPDSQGLDTFDQLHRQAPDIPVVVMSGLVDEETAVQAVQAGAQDYLVKGRVGWESVSRAVRYAIERQQARAALRSSERRFRALIENSADAVALLTADGTILYESPAATRILGYTPEYLVGRNSFDLLYEEDRPTAAALFGQVLENPRVPVIGNFRYRHQDGQWRWIEATGTNLLNEPEVRAIVLNYRDISERKQAETALRESEERYRLMVETATFGIVVHIDNKIVFANKASMKLIGAHNSQELQGRSIIEFIHPDEREMILDLVRAAFEEDTRATDDEPMLVEERLIKLDGSQVTVEASAVAINYYGKPGLLVLLNDITQRKAGEKQIYMQAHLLNAVGQAVVATHPDGDILYWNRFAETLYGWSAQEAAGRNIKEVIPRHSSQEEEAEIFKNVAAGDSWSGEISVRDRNGRTFPTHVTNTPFFDDTGGLAGVIGISMDISEQKRAEETLRQRLVEAEALYAVSASLRTAQTTEEALPVLLDQTLAALDCEAGSIWLHHPSSGELCPTVARGWFREILLTPLKPGQGVPGTVYSSGQVDQSPALTSDLFGLPPDMGFVPSGQAGVCVPIRTVEEIIGVLMIAHPASFRLTGEQMRLLTSLAEMAGVGLHRIRLHEETVRHLDQLQTLRTIDMVISSSFDLRHILNILVEHITAQLQVDAACVLLTQPSSTTLRYAAGHGFRTRAIERAHFRLGEGRGGRVALDKITLAISLPQPDRYPEQAASLADENFAAYYGVPLIAKGQVKGVLEIYHRSPLNPDPDWLNFLETLAGQTALAIDNSQLFENLQQANMALSIAYDATIEGWSRALDLRDEETEGHTQRVADMALRLARQMGIGEVELMHVRWGALLHDIGKMGIADQILKKPGPLSEDEWLQMCKHPRSAFDLLSPISYLGRSVDIPYCHHEKWDGTGYPRGLRGEEIPLIARIFTIVDVWDAVSSDRPYRPAWPRERAVQHVLSEKGKAFDPKVVNAFMELLDNYPYKAA